MARQEATSIFSDGLMSDLHPINTPKSVLTDCLNGTYITYNGNEFILQNDMGNYKLKNCRLPVNFIPVGVKGYADILYIVSYNPITKMVEIGSYPAPQSIFTTGDSPNLEADETDLAPFIIKNEAVYPEIIDKYKKPIFIFTDTDEETYKLYPGDEFKFSGELPTLDFTYQHLNFYILDEDNKLYDIDDSLLYRRTTDNSFQLTSQEMRKVFWETPGWLAAQYNLYVPDKFNLNLRSLNVSEFLTQRVTRTSQINPSLDLNAQVIISDPFFIAELNKNFNANVFRDLFIRFEKSSNQTSSTNNQIVDVACSKHNYQDNILTAYVNTNLAWDINVDSNNLDAYIQVSAYPIIKYNNKTLKYTQFTTTLKFDLDNLKNPEDIKIGKKIYKWAADTDSCTLSFDIEGPFINVSNVIGRYAIKKWNYNSDEGWASTYVTGERPETTNLPIISNLILFGQNTINLDFDDFFIKEEGIYSIEIGIYENRDANDPMKSEEFILIPSEVFNDFFGTNDNYLTSLTMTDWVGKYKEKNTWEIVFNEIQLPDVNNTSLQMNNNDGTSSDIYTNVNDHNEYFLNNFFPRVPSTQVTDNLNKYLNVTLKNFIKTITIDHTINPTITGKLWNTVYNKTINLDKLTLANPENNQFEIEDDVSIANIRLEFLEKIVTEVSAKTTNLLNPTDNSTLVISESDNRRNFNMTLNNYSQIHISPGKFWKPGASDNEIWNRFDSAITDSYNGGTFDYSGFSAGDRTTGFGSGIVIANATSDIHGLENKEQLLTYDTVNDPGLRIFKAANSSTGKRGCVVVQMNEAVWTVLSAIKVKSAGSSSNNYFYECTSQNTLESEYIINVNNLIFNFNVTTLSTGGFTYYENGTLKNIEINIPNKGALLNGGAINLDVSQNISITPEILTIDLLSNDSYNFLYYNLQSIINQYNADIRTVIGNTATSQTNELIYSDPENETFQFLKSKLVPITGNIISPKNVGWLAGSVDGDECYLWAVNLARQRDDEPVYTGGNTSAAACLCRYDEVTI